MFRAILAVTLAMALPTVVAAGTNLTYFPTDGTPDTADPIGIAGDSAPGFSSGSFQGNGSAKTAIYIDPADLFGSSITVGDIDSISYWTKRDVSFGDVNPYLNWYAEIFTTPDGTDDDAWYGRRLNMEPYFAISPSAPTDTWTQWSTDAGTNQLRVFDANRGSSGPIYGTYSDPTLADITGGTVNWNSYYSGYENASYDYRDEEVWFMGISTGSGWASGFDGQVDGVTISLKNGDSATVNFEVPEPASLSVLALGGLLVLRRRR